MAYLRYRRRRVTNHHGNWRPPLLAPSSPAVTLPARHHSGRHLSGRHLIGVASVDVTSAEIPETSPGSAHHVPARHNTASSLARHIYWHMVRFRSRSDGIYSTYLSRCRTGSHCGGRLTAEVRSLSSQKTGLGDGRGGVSRASRVPPPPPAVPSSRPAMEAEVTSGQGHTWPHTVTRMTNTQVVPGSEPTRPNLVAPRCAKDSWYRDCSPEYYMRL